MAIDKNKTIEAATKYVQKGQYDKAIKEYNKLLEVDRKDARIQQKLGELYQKKGDNALAAECFLKVAENYSTDGFFLKAVAVYKQVLKLNPDLVDVNLKLAELHQQLGLLGDAMAQYQQIVNYYDKVGDTKASLDTLRRMVDLDPDNIPSRTKLAELYARESMTKEAAAEFLRAAEYLKKNNRIDDYLRVAERLIALEPSNVELTRELASIYLSKQDPKRALAKLQICFKDDPKDVRTLEMLAQAFKVLGQTSKTVSVYKELAKIHEEHGRAADGMSAWRRVLELAPDDPDALAKIAPPPAPPQPSVVLSAPQPAERTQPRPNGEPSPGARPPSPASGDPVSKLLTETDVYVKYGLHQKALEHLKKVFAADPDCLDGHEKAAALYGLVGNSAAAADSQARAAELALAAGLTARARENLEKLLERAPGHPRGAALQSALGNAAESHEEIAEAQIEEEAVLVEAAEEIVEVGEAPEPDLALETAAQTLDDGEIVDEPLLGAGGRGPAVELEVEGEEAENSGSMELPHAPEASVFEDDLALQAAAMTPDIGDAETLVEEVPDEAFAGGAPSETLLEPAPAHEEPLAASDEEIPGAAEVLLEPASPAPGLAPLGADGPEGLETGDAPAEQAVEVEVEQAAAPESGPVVEDDVPPEAAENDEEDPAGDELDEAAFFIEQNVFEEAREILETVMLAYPDSARARELMALLESREAAAAQPPAEATEPAGEPAQAAAGFEDASFDLAAELAKEDFGDVLEAPPATEDFQYSVEDVFQEFKKGVQKIVKPEDVDTHYDLGIAYKEMGLLDDAIGEFEQAAGAAAGKKKEVECLTMVGLCRVERGEFEQAIDAFKRGLGCVAVSTEAAKALHFEMGLAYQSLGKVTEAFSHFRKVEKADPKYRDVHAVVEKLRAQAGPALGDSDETSVSGKRPAERQPTPARPIERQLTPARPAERQPTPVKPDAATATGPERPTPNGGAGGRGRKVGYV